MDDSEMTTLCEIAFVANAFLTLFFTNQYILARKLYKIFINALERGVNSVHISDLTGESPTYAVVRGKVKSLGPLIQSFRKPDIYGVFQNFTIEEHAVKRWRGMWHHVRDVIDKKSNNVPFAIVDGKYKITIASPVNARFLCLPLIDDHFEAAQDSIFSLLFGMHQKGFQYTEYMLRENEIITGFGEVIKSEGGMQLIPPKNGADFIVSTMDPESIAAELRNDKTFYGSFACVFGLIGAYFAGILIKKWWRHYKKKRQEEMLQDMNMKIRIERQRNTTQNEINNESFICIICLEQRREVILLPCGHIIVCFDCARACMRKPCPVCRQDIDKFHLIYFS